MPEPSDELRFAILDRQRQAWAEGWPRAAEDFLRDAALPQEHTEVLLDLLYNEIVLREERGERPSLEEYASRYPALREELELHFDVHSALQEELLDATCVSDSTRLAAPDLSGPLPTLSNYDLVGVLGHGGMGVVYKARHRLLGRHVALKMFQPGRRPTPRELARFRMEAEAIARLQHPNIVQIFEVGEANGLPFIALELVEGGTLAERLEHERLTPAAAATLIEVLARAVHHAHERDIIHRDLKPANVLFGEGMTPKIADFGLAKLMESDPGLAHDASRSGEPVGTPRYMSPEQAAGRNERIGPATDVYALGTLLYECLTGRAPFMGSSVIDTLDRIRHDEPLSPRRLERSIPRDLETICLACLHKEPRRRYSTALALADDLGRFLHAEPIRARRTPAWERGWLWCRRRPAQAALVAVAMLLVLGGTGAAIANLYAEQARLGRSRDELKQLTSQGVTALEAGDPQTAQQRFQAAWSIVRAEPALAEHELSVSGWLDHSSRELEQRRWKQMKAPASLEERRDDLFVSSLLPGQATNRAVRAALADALSLASGNDARSHAEREDLVLLESALALPADPTVALATLEAHPELRSRLIHARRAQCLELVGRGDEAAREREAAEGLPPREAAEGFLAGCDALRRRDFAGAAQRFDRVLAAEPEHFRARLLQAVCFLELGRTAEARVALTGCLAQKPAFAWTRLLRGLALARGGELPAAFVDAQKAGAPTSAAMALLQARLCAEIGARDASVAGEAQKAAVAALTRALDFLSAEEGAAFWQDQVSSNVVFRALRERADYGALRRRFAASLADLPHAQETDP